LILKLKRVGKLTGNQTQLQPCMKPSDVSTGMLKNFNVTKLKGGIKRFVL